MVSHPETGSDSPIGSDRDRGRDNESTTEKFGLISKNRSFIKEKGFHHPMTSLAKPL